MSNRKTQTSKTPQPTGQVTITTPKESERVEETRLVAARALLRLVESIAGPSTFVTVSNCHFRSEGTAPGLTIDTE